MDMPTVDGSTVLVSVVGSLLSSGALVFWLQSRREDKREHNTRVEQLYRSVHAWCNKEKDIVSMHGLWMRGFISIEWLNKWMADHSDMKEREALKNECAMLVGIYFPSVRLHLDAVREANSSGIGAAGAMSLGRVEPAQDRSNELGALEQVMGQRALTFKEKIVALRQ
jgi:hypothetical protein